jgi:hypothetical protein
MKLLRPGEIPSLGGYLRAPRSRLIAFPPADRSRQHSSATGGLPVPANNLVTAIGDSVTVAAATSGGTAPSVASFAKYHGQLVNAAGVGGFLTWAAILPKTGESTGTGKLRWAGVHATGGATINQVHTSHVTGSDSPLFDNPKPGICVIAVGLNDAANFGTQPGIDSRVAEVSVMCDELIAGGILPVIAACPPHNGFPLTVPNFNTTLAAMAASRGLVYVDWHTPLANPDGTWKLNHNTNGTDNGHPSVRGGVVMGQVLRDAIDHLLPNVTPTLATTATDDLASYLYKNGSFTDDGNADGVPDGGQTQSSTYWNLTANGTAWTLGARAGYSGQALRWNKTTDPGTSTLQSTAAGTPVPLCLDGHTIAFGFRAEVASWSINTEFDIEGWKLLDAASKPFRLKIGTDFEYTLPIAPFVWYQEWLVPAGFDDADGGKLRTNMQILGTGTNTMDAYIGQFTLRDNSV